MVSALDRTLLDSVLQRLVVLYRPCSIDTRVIGRLGCNNNNRWRSGVNNNDNNSSNSNSEHNYNAQPRPFTYLGVASLVHYCRLSFTGEGGHRGKGANEVLIMK